MKTLSDNKALSGLLLAAILIVAMAFRVTGADVGLPNDFVPDEETKITTISRLEANYFQHWESQPSFMYYSLYGILKVVTPFKEQIIATTGMQARFTGPTADFAFDKWIGRLYMGFLGTLTCFFLYRLGKILGGKTTGLIAAYIYAVAPMPIALCHYIKEDTPLVLFTTINLVCCMKVLRKGRTKDYFLAGLTAGLAFAAKYPGIMTLFILGGAVVLRERGSLGALPSKLAKIGHVARLMKLPLAIFTFTFFCVCFTYLDVIRLGSGLLFQTEYMVTGHHDGLSDSPLSTFFLFYIRRSLIPGLTFPIFALSIPGIFFLWRRSRTMAIIPLAWGLGYLFLAECLPAKPYPFFSRYIIPVFPMFCVYAAIALSSLPGFLARFVPARVGQAAVFVGGAVILSTPLYFSWLFVSHANPDTRELAMAWAEKNIPPGSVIFSTVPRYTGYFDESSRTVLDLKRSGYQDRRDAYPDQLVFAMVSGFAIDRFLEHKKDKPKDFTFWNETIMKHGKLLAEFTPSAPTYGYHNPWVRIYALPPDDETHSKSSAK